MANSENMKLLEKQAEIIKAVAHPIRIAIINVLKKKPYCVCDIVEQTGSERSNISKHLSIMTSAGILDCRKDGLKVIYSLKTPCIMDFLACTTKVLKSQLKENKKLLEII